MGCAKLTVSLFSLVIYRIMYQVLVCGNREELEHERQRVCIELANMDCVATGFAFNRYNNDELYQVNLKALEQADYVLFIMSNTYGCLSPSGVGFVHQIYAQANARSIPVASLLYSEEDKRGEDDVDFTRFKGFKAQLMHSTHRHWKTLDEVKLGCRDMIAMLLKEYPAIGYNRAIDIDEISQVEQLKREKKALEKELENLAHAGDHHEGEVRVQELNFSFQMFAAGNTHKMDDRIILDWQKLFLLFAPALTSFPTESRLYRTLCDKILEAVRPALKNKYQKSHAFLNLKVRMDNFDELKVKYLSDGLAVEDDGRWKLTSAGNRKLMRLMAEKRMKI
jgi:hypothetical protein